MSFEASLDRCVQCGFCLNACPTYRITRDEEFSPRGRIALMRAIVAGEVEPEPVTLRTYGQCLGCRACESACPAGVVYEEVFLAGREALALESGPGPWHVRALLFTIRHRVLIGVARTGWRFLGRLAIRGAQYLPQRQPFALLAALPDPDPEPAGGTAAPDAVIHRGCLMDIFWEGTNSRAVGLLGETGISAGLLSPAAGCCGALHAHQGDRETARRLARQVITTFERSGAGTLVSLAGGCGAFIHSYPDLFEPDDPWHERAVAVSQAVTDVASLLVQEGYAPSPVEEIVTYQDSCHLRHGLKVWREPRALLLQAGRYREMPDADQCCGSAGVYNMTHPEISDQILAAKVEEVAALGVDAVVTSNPGCELQWRMGMRRTGLPIEVRHLVDHLSRPR